MTHVYTMMYVNGQGSTYMELKCESGHGQNGWRHDEHDQYCITCLLYQTPTLHVNACLSPGSK